MFGQSRRYMQHNCLQTNNASLSSRLKRNVFLLPRDGVTKGEKRVVPHLRKRRFNALGKQGGGFAKSGMEKRVLSPFTGGRRVHRHMTIHIQSTQNNTIYTLSGEGGGVYRCISAGMCGFRNTRKSTGYASQIAAERLRTLVKGPVPVRIKMAGLGAGKVSGVRALHQAGFRVTKIEECTALAHNGCRPARRRRL